MGLFSMFSGKSGGTGSSPTLSSSTSRRLSPMEAKREVRADLHDKLGKVRGEEVYNTMAGYLDKDGFGSSGMSGSEVRDLVHKLEKNHLDNLHSDDIRHVEAILGKHFND
jgi:hypothetical protein